MTQYYPLPLNAQFNGRKRSQFDAIDDPFVLDLLDEIGQLKRQVQDMECQMEVIAQHGDALTEELWRERSTLTTDLNRAIHIESILRQSEEELQAFFNAMSAVVLVYDRKGFCLRVAGTHPAFPRETLYAQVGKQLHKVMSVEQATTHFNAIQVALRRKEMVQVDYQARIGRKVYWFDAQISPLSADTVVWVARDVTQQKRIEQTMRMETDRSERLLHNILPKPIVKRLKEDNKAIAEHYESATILFADIVGFTTTAASRPPIDLVKWLNEIFSAFDQLSDQFGVEKIKTIGDAYMAVAGLPIPRADHAAAIAQMALAMQAATVQFSDGDQPLSIRIGINTGPVVAGVIGKRKFIYDLWGDTVNVASRMESTGRAGMIQMTEATYEQLRHPDLKSQFCLKKRGMISVKGRGKMKTYWLMGQAGSEPTKESIKET
jgi:adenylate cyclase